MIILNYGKRTLFYDFSTPSSFRKYRFLAPSESAVTGVHQTPIITSKERGPISREVAHVCQP
jgi:hypothetical protein